MLEHFEKQRIFISVVVIVSILVNLLFWPTTSRSISMVVLLSSTGLATIFIVQDHWQSYVQAECTREKMTQNLTRDVLGLLLGMAAAIFAGGLAGQWAGMQAGLWAGLAAGFLVGFLAAWLVRSVWGRWVPLA